MLHSGMSRGSLGLLLFFSVVDIVSSIATPLPTVYPLNDYPIMPLERTDCRHPSAK